jgi:hypothetical protein
MRNLVSLFVVLAVLLAAASAEAQSAVIDQIQSAIDRTAGSLGIGGPNEQQLAQVVTVGVEGELTGVYLPIACSDGRLIIEIRDLDGDAPGTTVLRRRVFRASRIPPLGFVHILFGLGRGLFFVPGDRFAIVLRNTTGSCGIAPGPEGDLYARGEGFFDARPNPPGWVPFSETETRLDLPFMTVMALP